MKVGGRNIRFVSGYVDVGSEGMSTVPECAACMCVTGLACGECKLRCLELFMYIWTKS